MDIWEKLKALAIAVRKLGLQSINVILSLSGAALLTPLLLEVSAAISGVHLSPEGRLIGYAAVIATFLKWLPILVTAWESQHSTTMVKSGDIEDTDMYGAEMKII